MKTLKENTSIMLVDELRLRIIDLEAEISSIKEEQRMEAEGPDWIQRAMQAEAELDAIKGRQESVSSEYQDRDGKWCPFNDEFHKANTIKDGSWPVRDLYLNPAPIPEGWQLVPIEPTPEMVERYLDANTMYWVKIDQLPQPLGQWRDGTPKQATAESYKAMLSAAPKQEGWE